jgi:hypothetical protein
VDAEKLARFARLDPKILRPIAHRTVAQQEALTLIRARNLIVRLRTGAVNAVRGLAKPSGYRLPASSTLCFAKRCMAALPPGLVQALGPVLEQIAEMTVKIKAYDRLIKQLTETEYPETMALTKVYGVGQLTAADVCPDPGKQRALPAKPRCWLLSRPATAAQPVRRARSSTRHHQGRQRLSALAAGRVRQPRSGTTRERLQLAAVGTAPGIAWRQAISKPCHRCRSSKTSCTAPSHLGTSGSLRTLLRCSCLKKVIILTCCDDPVFR